MSTTVPDSNYADAPGQTSTNVILCALAAANIAIHLYCANGYGFFRDELYYLACSNHMDWGYVDHPPLSIALLWIQRALLGDSLFALRVFPAIAAGILTILVGRIAREMGGGRFAQGLAALAALITPVYLGMTDFFSMNAFDCVFWALAIYILCRLINTDDAKWWLWFGLIAGLGLENKLSFLFLGAALAVGIVLTPLRKHLLSPYLYAGGAIALVLFLPHIIWQVQHKWITLEFMHNASQKKNAPTNPLKYFLDQILIAHPLLLPIWVSGLIACLVAPSLRKFQLFGIMYVTLFLIYSFTHGKPYYLSPAYPLVLPAGVLMVERITKGQNGRWLRSALVIVLILGGCATAPMAMPLLPPDTLIAYQTALGLRVPNDEHRGVAPLDQIFADRFGWLELVEEVARVYNDLPAADRTQCTIIASNYGEAAAIDWFGPKFGLPHAISTHNNYWIWGPGTGSSSVVISVGGGSNDLKKLFEESAQAGFVEHPLSQEQHIRIWVFRRLKPGVNIQQIWPTAKNMI